MTYTDTTFTPIFDIPTNDTLTAFCNNDLQCIFDVIMTNNTELGEDTALTLGEVKEKAKTLGMFVTIHTMTSRVSSLYRI